MSDDAATGPGSDLATGPASDPTSDLLTGSDGLARCAWAGSAPDYLAYHDDEWGQVVRGDAALYERLCLEAFQSGLSWLTVLRKRPTLRAGFADFDPAAVAAFTPADVARLLADPGVIRNRAKIEAAIGNARAVCDLGAGGLDALVWKHAPPPRPRPRSLADVPASTPASVALARELKAIGVRFVGPTTAYATMQACGLVDDHLAGCAVPPTRR